MSRFGNQALQTSPVLQMSHKFDQKDNRGERENESVMVDDFMMPCSGAKEESGASARHGLRLCDVRVGGGVKA